MEELLNLKDNWRLYAYTVFNFIVGVLLFFIPTYFVILKEYAACNTEGLDVRRMKRIVNPRHYHILRNEAGKDISIVCFGFQFAMFSFSSHIDGTIYDTITYLMKYSQVHYYRAIRELTYDRFLK